MKKILILISVIICVIVFTILFKPKEEKEWYEDYNQSQIVIATKNFLKEKVNYPDTFEFVDYPNIKYGTEQEKTVILTGEFKCSNGFGVYGKHNYYVKIKLGEKWLVMAYNIN